LWRLDDTRRGLWRLWRGNPQTRRFRFGALPRLGFGLQAGRCFGL
jgi:hypothetical protein